MMSSAAGEMNLHTICRLFRPSNLLDMIRLISLVFTVGEASGAPSIGQFINNISFSILSFYSLNLIYGDKVLLACVKNSLGI